MKPSNQFVWADLSTYNPTTSKAFYEKVFDWRFHDTGGYFVAMKSSREIAGLYETPNFFQKIKMPHFWMSYIAVEDAVATAELTKQFSDAKVELVDDFYEGKIALIRDPQGAGFTVYDGGKLPGRGNKPSHLIWNELHVSEADKVIPFYEQLFEWTIKPYSGSNSFNIFCGNNEHIADLSVIPNELKGKYEYWVCTFAVKDLRQTRDQIIQSGGRLVHDEGARLMMSDNSGEAFFYIQQAG